MNTPNLLKTIPFVLAALLLTACATEPGFQRSDLPSASASPLAVPPAGTTDRNQASKNATSRNDREVA